MASEDVGYIVQVLDEVKGRGMIATQAFEKGQTILQENPW